MRAPVHVGRGEGASGAGPPLLAEAQVQVAAETFRMLADPTRLRLLWALAEGGELDVGALTRLAGVARPAASQHLAKLRLARFVETRRSGRRVLYRIRGGHLRRVIAEAVFHADHEVSGAPPHA